MNRTPQKPAVLPANIVLKALSGWVRFGRATCLAVAVLASALTCAELGYAQQPNALPNAPAPQHQQAGPQQAAPQPPAAQEQPRTADQRQPGRRVALIVGNSKYQAANTLRNPVADAAAMQVALHALGFELIVGQDLTLAVFGEKVREFAKAMQNADVALFFYAGHGVQYGDQNYLLPTDIALTSEAEVTAKSIALNEVLEAMAKHARTSVVFLDACRDSPQFRSASAVDAATARQATLKYARGLAEISGKLTEYFIGFAASPGTTAEDGRGRNSPFTTALLRHIQKPDVEIAAMFSSVRADVVRTTKRQQRPEARIGLSKVLYLNPGAAAAAAPEPNAATEDGAPLVSLSKDAEFWMAIKDTYDASNFEQYLKEYPQGRFAALAKRRIEDLKVDPSRPSRPPGSEFVQVTGAARISAVHPKEEALRSARALARARAIAIRTPGPPAALPAAVSTSAEAAGLLAYLARGITLEEVWTTNANAAGEVRVEMRAKVQPLPALAERKLIGQLEKSTITASEPIRFRLTAKRDVQLGVYAWQADGSVLRLYPDSTRRQPIAIKAGESVWFPRSNDSYPALASANMPGETSNHEALIVVTGGRATIAQLENLVPVTITRATQHAGPGQTDAAEFLTRLAALRDPELELLVLPYDVQGKR